VRECVQGPPAPVLAAGFFKNEGSRAQSQALAADPQVSRV